MVRRIDRWLLAPGQHQPVLLGVAAGGVLLAFGAGLNLLSDGPDNWVSPFLWFAIVALSSYLRLASRQRQLRSSDDGHGLVGDVARAVDRGDTGSIAPADRPVARRYAETALAELERQQRGRRAGEIAVALIVLVIALLLGSIVLFVVMALVGFSGVALARASVTRRRDRLTRALA